MAARRPPARAARPAPAAGRALVSIIFSLLFLVVQWAFGSLSARLNLFRDDPIVWRTFGLAIGVFVFSVITALAIGDRPKIPVIVPVPAQTRHAGIGMTRTCWAGGRIPSAYSGC